MTLNRIHSKMADQNPTGGVRDAASMRPLSNGRRDGSKRDTKGKCRSRKLGGELCREDLLFLLSMLEGELQVGVIMNNTFPHLFPPFMRFED